MKITICIGSSCHLKGSRQIVGVLLAKRMKMKAVQQGDQAARHLAIPLFPRCAEAAAGSAGVI